MKLSSLNLANIVSSIKMISVIPYALFTRLFRDDIWIITERPNQARDNGYCFFKYLKENHKERKVYYIIKKSSDDYSKISKYNGIIEFDSWRHYYYYCLSKVHISAHVGGCCPTNTPICRRIKKPLGIKNIFLPHGVSYGISEFCLKKYANIDLFICSGKPEYDNILANYGYNQSEVTYTGFPRLDSWHDIKVNSKQILIMPTWRLYLAQNPSTEIEKTLYFKMYSSFLNSKTLHLLLEQNGLQLIFYLHHEMRKYVNSFSTKCPNIEIVYKDDTYDIQELLKESALLVTDYSSVHFDFAYILSTIR